MKLHKSLVKAVVETLQRILNEGIYADKAIEQVLKQNSRWGSRDRRFIAETTYEMVRWLRLVMRTAELRSAEKTEELYYLVGIWLIIKGEDLPEWDEFSAIDKDKIRESYQSVKDIRKFQESIPDWLDELGCSELGEGVWEKEIHELNKEAQVVLRVNELKTSRSKLAKLLNDQSIETISPQEFPEALILVKRKNLQLLTEYKNGLFEIQDASSQLIAPFMDLKHGMVVIDACAGAGGKSLHIAAIMKNNGKIISMDVEERKLVELKKRADRGGVSIIQTKMISPESIEKLKNTADRLLLDVPCSGIGVLRRNPDAKWKLNLDFINRVKETQQEIICNYSQMLRSNGIMVYATCSILPSENQDQVQKFLKENSNFELICDRKVMPSEGFDGFYMAKLRKKA